MRKLSIIFPLIIAFGCLIYTKPTFGASFQQSGTQDEQPASECYPLDIIFLIDQSSSMSSSTANDPTDQRVYAPRWAIDWLADNALDICPDSIHRIAIVSYGTEAVTDLELSFIDPNSTEEWINLRSKLKENIQAKDLIQTHPKLAFERAAEILSDAAPVPGETPRKTLIVFITDGEPYLSDPEFNFITYINEMKEQVNELFPFDSTLLKQEICLKEAQEKFSPKETPEDVSNKCLEDNRVNSENFINSTYIWTMLLKQQTSYSNYLRDAYVDIAESHAGSLIDLKENRQDIPSNFLKIMTQLAGVKAQRLSCGNFAVNPYLRQARLTFFKIDEDTEVKLSYKDPHGDLYQLINGESNGGFDVVEHYSEGANERYVINDPYPAIWRFESDACQGIDAYFEPLELDVGGLQPLTILQPDGDSIPPEATFDFVQIPKYSSEPYFDSENPYYLQYIVRDGRSDVIRPEEDPFFGINFTAEIIDPQGNITPYEMGWDDETLLYQSNDPLQMPYQGEYLINISADIANRDYPYGPVDINLTKDMIFDTSRHLFDYENKILVHCPHLDLVSRCPWSTYTGDDGCEVCPIKEFEINIIEPQPGENLGSIHGTILDGWPLPILPIDHKFQITGTGSETIDPDFLFINPSRPVKISIETGTQVKNPGYNQDVENPTIYAGTVTDMDAEGSYKLLVELDSEYSEFYTPANEKSEISFTREDGLLNRMSTYFMLLGLLIFALMVFIVYQILIRNNKVRGTLVFKATDTIIDSFPVNSSKNWINIKNRFLKNNPHLDLAKLKVSSLPKPKTKRSVKTEDEELFTNDMFDSEYDRSSPGVRVSGKTIVDKHKFDIILDPNLPTDYSDDSVASMVYEPPED